MYPMTKGIGEPRLDVGHRYVDVCVGNDLPTYYNYGLPPTYILLYPLGVYIYVWGTDMSYVTDREGKCRNEPTGE
jgi:hypothetical protein